MCGVFVACFLQDLGVSRKRDESFENAESTMKRLLSDAMMVRRKWRINGHFNGLNVSSSSTRHARCAPHCFPWAWFSRWYLVNFHAPKGQQPMTLPSIRVPRPIDVELMVISSTYRLPNIITFKSIRNHSEFNVNSGWMSTPWCCLIGKCLPFYLQLAITFLGFFPPPFTN